MDSPSAGQTNSWIPFPGFWFPGLALCGLFVSPHTQGMRESCSESCRIYTEHPLSLILLQGSVGTVWCWHSSGLSAAFSYRSLRYSQYSSSTRGELWKTPCTGAHPMKEKSLCEPEGKRDVTGHCTVRDSDEKSFFERCCN